MRGCPHRLGQIIRIVDLGGDQENGIATGNIEAGAQAKLRFYGLADLIADGAFCRGPGERRLIAQAALAEAERRIGAAPDSDRTFVIGDTPHDIECARAVGVRCIAVATGDYSVDELAASGAWRAFARLPEPADFRVLVGVPVRGGCEHERLSPAG